VLGESYVLLPTASASRSMLLMQKLAPPSGFAGLPGSEDGGPVFNELGEDLYASARYNLSLRQQQQQQQHRRRGSPVNNRRDGLRGVLGGSGNGRSELVDSAFDVPTLADLNRQVQLLTAHHAHWYVLRHCSMPHMLVTWNPGIIDVCSPSAAPEHP